MSKPENSTEMDNQELDAVVGGAAATRRVLYAIPTELKVTRDVSAGRRLDLSKLLAPGLTFEQRTLPDFAVLMQLEYK